MGIVLMMSEGSTRGSEPAQSSYFDFIQQTAEYLLPARF